MITFSLFGIKIYIRFMFVALVTILLLVDKSGVAVIGLIACFIHELGHVCMFFLVGLTPLELHFELTGIRLVKPIAALCYHKEVLVQLAGSATNFLMFFLLCNTITSITPSSIFATTHLILGIFNLLPLKTFDGGKLLEITLLHFFTIKSTDTICSIVDIIFLLIMLFFSIVGFFAGDRSITLLILSGFLIFTALVKLFSNN